MRLLHFILTSLLISMLFGFVADTDFITQQKKYSRVRTSFEEKESLVKKNLKDKDINFQNLRLILVAYKQEDILDLYARDNKTKTFQKITSYAVCAKSGSLGPKSKMGDRQVPEGFYHIDRFNPNSNFYLSLGLNYPNAADRKRSKAANLGGDIFIHGSCVTIGCLPLTDDKIKELYLYTLFAKNYGQDKIPVYAFPFIMDDATFAKHQIEFKNQPELLKFWGSLKIGYQKFAKNKLELSPKWDANGNYVFE